uniref:Uncharacterized protein n=1 Tax=Plectus sambesii TaxID=2011161 RepID=A0A914XI85_9BILA
MNPCFCWNLKDGCVTVGIWSLIFGIAQMCIFGWQTAAIKYEKDRAANVLTPGYNTYGRLEDPAYYEQYAQSSEEKFYNGLFIIQILCLIAAFFLLFASVSLIYGIHTNSRYLVWPWFPCIITSILCSIAYCVMWWSGDVRGYWLVLTILEIFSVLINIYCVICVIEPLPPKTAPQDADTSGGEDYTSHWVKQSLQHIPAEPFTQQPLTEPPSPVKEEAPILHHAQSVPSIRAESKHHRHSSRRHKHRHRAHSVGSRSRRSSKTYSSDSDDSDDDRRGRCRHCHKKRRHHHSRSRSRDKYSDTDTGYSERSYRHSEKHRRHRHRDDDGEECDCESKKRHHRRPRDVKKRSDRDKSTIPLVERPGTSATNNGSWTPNFPLNSAQGGLTIPQHIVIPPSASGNDKPQRYQINSEITVSYNPDKSVPPRDGGRIKHGSQQRLAAPITANQRGQQMLTNGRSGVENGHQRHSSDSVGAGSSDSRGHGSTAV